MIQPGAYEENIFVLSTLSKAFMRKSINIIFIGTAGAAQRCAWRGGHRERAGPEQTARLKNSRQASEA